MSATHGRVAPVLRSCALSAPLLVGGLAAPAFAGTLTVLHAFSGGADGAQPYKGPTLDSQGTLYGETFYGANACPDSYLYPNVGCGTAYKASPAGTLSTLATFKGGNGADGFSNVTVVGKTLYGGAYLGGAHNEGLLFSVTTGGKAYTILHSFSGTDGQNPNTYPRIGSNGVIYSVTASGGPGYSGSDPSGQGVLFALMPDGTFVSEHPFSGGADGGGPGRIFLDKNDTIFGATGVGGSCTGAGVPSNGCGTIYSFVPSTGVFTVLYSMNGTTDGYAPQIGGMDAKGNLYGSAGHAGAHGYGTLFKLAKTKSGYNFQLLWSFSGGADGANPLSPPSLAADGSLVGATFNGPVTQSSSGEGVLYEFNAGALTPLFTFTNDANGGYPQATPIRDKSGTIYGTTNYGGVAPCNTTGGTLISSYGCGVLYQYTP